MRNAPSVVYPVGRCVFQAWLLVFLGGVSAAVGLFFLVESDLPTQGSWACLTQSLGLFAWLVWMTWAFLSWSRSPEGSLDWSPRGAGEVDATSAWSWTDRTASQSLVLSEMERVLDLQGLILLRICGPGMGQRWVWVEQNTFPARWSDLRRALVSSRA